MRLPWCVIVLTLTIKKKYYLCILFDFVCTLRF